MKYDIIGDIHGCFQEFQNLTDKLGYNWVAVYRFTLTNVNLHSLAILQTVVPHSLRMIEIVWELVIHKRSLLRSWKSL